MDQQNTPSKRDKHITWDEKIIAEHDLDRGTRMKIEEPKTPYHVFDEEEGAERRQSYEESLQDGGQDGASDAVSSPKPSGVAQPKSPMESGLGVIENQWSDLRQALQKEQQRQSNEGGKIVTGVERKSEEEFAAKRKQHYNEYQKLMEFRRLHGDSLDDDEDDEVSQARSGNSENGAGDRMEE